MIPSPVPTMPLIIAAAAAALLAGFAAWKAGSAAARGGLDGVLRIGGTRTAHAALFIPGRGDGPDVEELGAEPVRTGGFAIPYRVLGYAAATAAAAVGLTAILVAAGFVTAYPKVYQRAAWTSLAEQYGIHSAVADQTFRPGVPFAALVDGRSVDCTALPPASVSCDNRPVSPKK